MKDQIDPLSLQTMFARQRHEYEGQAPPFDATVQAALARREPSAPVVWARRGGAVAAAAAIVLLIVARPVLHRPAQRQPAPEPAPAVAFNWNTASESSELPWQTSVLVANWQSPTDFLSRPADSRPLSFDIN